MAMARRYQCNSTIECASLTGRFQTQYSYTDVGENTGRVMFAKNTASSTVSGGGRDDTLDRSFDYDHLGRLIVSHSGYEARPAHGPGSRTTLCTPK